MRKWKMIKDSQGDNMTIETINKAIEYIKCFKGSEIDIDNHRIVVPFSKGITEENLMQEGMLGTWFCDNGFNISFETRDYEYITKKKFNVRSMSAEKGHKALLRNRLVATITW